MKFTIEREIALSMLGRVLPVIEKRNSIQILDAMLIQAGTRCVTFFGTNMDVEIGGHVPADVSEQGRAAVNGHKLVALIKEFDKGATIEFEGGIITSEKVIPAKSPSWPERVEREFSPVILRGGRTRYALPVMDAGDVPVLKATGNGHTFQLSTRDLLGYSESVEFAISTEETRYYLNGIFLHGPNQAGKHDCSRMVTTNGHCLAIAHMPGVDCGPVPAIVPRLATNLFKKVFGPALPRKVEEPGPTLIVTMPGKEGGTISFESDDILLRTKVIDGTFPDYQRIIPGASEATLNMRTSELDKAIKRVTAILDKKVGAVRFSPFKGGMGVHASSPEYGMASEEIEIGHKGKMFDIGFNAQYCREILAHAGADEVRFEMYDARSPTRISPVGRPGAPVEFILMPVRV